jgi:hypothetical protein
MLERLEYGHTAAVFRQSGDDLAVHLDQLGSGLSDHRQRIVSSAHPIQREAVPESAQPVQPGVEQRGLQLGVRRVDLQHRLARLPCRAAQLLV